MRRIKSIDAFRGLCILYMIFMHIFEWWIRPSDIWVHTAGRMMIEFIGASGFLFISGISTTLSIRLRKEKVKSDPNYSKRVFLKEYYYRTSFFLAIGLIYNAVTVIWLWGIWGLWSWYILLTIPVCLAIGYPLVKLPKVYRIILAFLIVFITYPLFIALESLKEIDGGWWIIYHLLFNPPWEDPILPMFSFFCLGTVVGEVFYEIYSINDENLRRTLVKKKIVSNFLFYGTILILLSIISSIYIFNDPISFLIRGSFTWIIYAIGWDLIIMGLLTYLHEFKLSPKWKNRFLFYFSFYSLTIYLGHNIVSLIFWDVFNMYNFWIPTSLTVILFWLILRIMYKKTGSKFSLKTVISKAAVYLSKDKD